MNAVFLYGEDGDSAVSETLFAAVRAAGSSALRVTGRLVAADPVDAADPEYLVFDHFPAQNAALGGGIAVFGACVGELPDFLCIPNNYFAVFDAENNSGEIFQKNCRQTVPCGLSQKNTVTFSSIGNDTAVVALQRSLVTLKGNVAEPREIPLRFGAFRGNFALLAAAAVLILTEKVPENEFFIDF